MSCNPFLENTMRDRCEWYLKLEELIDVNAGANDQVHAAYTVTRLLYYAFSFFSNAYLIT